ncbi:MAG: acetoacetate decarboxylase family protein [Polyangiales bacterium]
MVRPYPDPPWEMHGMGVFAPTLTPVEDIELPPGFEPMSVAGRCAGMLAYVEYREPSPLTYHELIWMPCLVRAGGSRKARGYFVSVMYVDDTSTLAGGREIWKLPKTLARFERTETGVTVDGEDGTHVELSFRAFGPSLPARGRIVTLQPSQEGVVRFQGDASSKVRAARCRVVRFESTHGPWQSFRRASMMAGAAVWQEPFRSHMQAPTLLR